MLTNDKICQDTLGSHGGSSISSRAPSMQLPCRSRCFWTAHPWSMLQVTARLQLSGWRLVNEHGCCAMVLPDTRHLLAHNKHANHHRHHQPSCCLEARAMACRPHAP